MINLHKRIVKGLTAGVAVVNGKGYRLVNDPAIPEESLIRSEADDTITAIGIYPLMGFNLKEHHPIDGRGDLEWVLRSLFNSKQFDLSVQEWYETQTYSDLYVMTHNICAIYPQLRGVAQEILDTKSYHGFVNVIMEKI